MRGTSVLGLLLTGIGCLGLALAVGVGSPGPEMLAIFGPIHRGMALLAVPGIAYLVVNAGVARRRRWAVTAGLILSIVLDLVLLGVAGYTQLQLARSREWLLVIPLTFVVLVLGLFVDVTVNLCKSYAALRPRSGHGLRAFTLPTAVDARPGRGADANDARPAAAHERDERSR